MGPRAGSRGAPPARGRRHVSGQEREDCGRRVPHACAGRPAAQPERCAPRSGAFAHGPDGLRGKRRGQRPRQLPVVPRRLSNPTWGTAAARRELVERGHRRADAERDACDRRGAVRRRSRGGGGGGGEAASQTGRFRAGQRAPPARPVGTRAGASGAGGLGAHGVASHGGTRGVGQRRGHGVDGDGQHSGRALGKGAGAVLHRGGETT
mmetsp:Transcript_7240/g.13366  ORF Transcript_7240/g.13366 Transcript_7240/m.13366 type:complete len:208 (+) Transcript_7240:372-995(+)